MSPKDINPDDYSVVLCGPEPYVECVVQVESDDDLLFVLTDEDRSGNCIVEFPDEGERVLRRIRLDALRRFLDAAEQKLVIKKKSGD